MRLVTEDTWAEIEMLREEYRVMVSTLAGIALALDSVQDVSPAMAKNLARMAADAIPDRSKTEN